MRIYRSGSAERISADDPEAKQKLLIRIAELRALIRGAESANAIVAKNRKISSHSWAEMSRADLKRIGVNWTDIERILQLSPQRRYGVPYGEIVASKRDIERLEKRVEELAAREASPVKSDIQIGPARLVENRAANRLQIFFADKPPETVRSALRGHSFKWAPSAGAWQRQNTDNARRAATTLLRAHYPDTSAPAPPSPAEATMKTSKPQKRAVLKKRKPARVVRKTAAKAARKAAAKASALTANLRSWLENAPPSLAKRVTRALERARSNSQHRAAVAVGKRRLELRRGPEGFDLFDTKTSAPTPYVKPSPRAKKAARAYSNETPASLKRRLEREREAEAKKKIADELKRKRAARSKALQEQRVECKVDRTKASEANKGKGSSRRVAVAKSRETCSTKIRGIEEDFGHQIDELERQRPARKAPSKATRSGFSSVQRQERDDAMRGELERLDRKDLLPLWERVRTSPKFRDLSFDRAQERFAELVQEDRTAAEAARDRAVDAATDPGVLACSEAQYRAKQGDPTAKEWARENCNGNRPKGSAASRTLSMFGGIAPPPPEKPTKTKEPTAPARGRSSRGQQSLSTRMGASVLDSAVPF